MHRIAQDFLRTATKLRMDQDSPGDCLRLGGCLCHVLCNACVTCSGGKLNNVWDPSSPGPAAPAAACWPQDTTELCPL